MRRICEKYEGVLPSQLEGETFDQLLCMVLPETELIGLVIIDVGMGEQVPGAKPPPEGHASMAQYIRAQGTAKREAERKAAHEKRRRRGR